MIGITAALAVLTSMQVPSVAAEPAQRTPVAVRFDRQVRAGAAFGHAAPRLTFADSVAPGPESSVDDWNHPFATHWNPQDTVKRRGRAIRVSDGYATRLKIHQIGAVAMLPLVAGQFILGSSLDDDDGGSSGVKSAHKATAIAIGTVATVNSITGALNWWETRKNPEGRTRRTLHALLMLASDAGFLATAIASGDAGDDEDGRNRHRTLAEVSISLTVVSAVMMWLWKG
jgi:hypothetical protein